MNNIALKIAKVLVECSVIKKDETDTFVYGLDIFISSALETISILLIACFVGNLTETTLFFTAFIPLRIYAGGYHADTKLRCYITSLVVYFVFTIVTVIIPLEMYKVITLSTAFITTITVCLFAPVIHKNKNVNSGELKIYRKISIYICLIEVLIIILFTVIYKKSILILAFSLGQFSETVAIWFALVKERIKV